MLNGVGTGGEVLIQDIAVEPDAAFPGDGGRVRIDADLLELAHVPPQLERADLEQVAEEYAAFEAVIEAQPQFVVLLGLACRDSMHLVPLLFHSLPLVAACAGHSLHQSIIRESLAFTPS